MRLKNEHFDIEIDERGGIRTLIVQATGRDMIAERRLISAFRIGLPLPGLLCHYIEGHEQAEADVKVKRVSGTSIITHVRQLRSAQGVFDIELMLTIDLRGDEVHFSSEVTNRTEYPIAELWYPRWGGLGPLGSDRDPVVQYANYIDAIHEVSWFKKFPGSHGLGSEAAEWRMHYPGYSMPWFDLYDREDKHGLMFMYLDPTLRLSMFHCYLHPTVGTGTDSNWLTPAQAGDTPVGLVLSHVRFPFVTQGETFRGGELVIKSHPGDWHTGSLAYREWFLRHFPLQATNTWVRRQRTWFTSIIYQPEDKVIADYETYARWCTEAKELAGVTCCELIGWDKGGLERDYPEYVPEDRLGGKAGFKRLLAQLKEQGLKCLVFTNYMVLDTGSDWFRRELHRYLAQDQFYNLVHWGAWGESTLLARFGLSVRRHGLGTPCERLQEVHAGYFEDIVRMGAEGMQVDKLGMFTRTLDFNPASGAKPDVAHHETLVQGMKAIWRKCLALNPDFAFASESTQDRFVEFSPVFYRAASRTGISTMRYVFPEWTACVHIKAPDDTLAVNYAVMNGAVIVLEPFTYQGSVGHPIYHSLAAYVKRVEALRGALEDRIFFARYQHTVGAEVWVEDPRHQSPIASAGGQIAAEAIMLVDEPARAAKPAGSLPYAVHRHFETGLRALVVVNPRSEAVTYRWAFDSEPVSTVTLWTPEAEPRAVVAEAPLTIAAGGLHVIVEG
jgi:hypothetical protein